jgi:ssDNA-binding Zn-finger/Zn-ribbon topoisomerase 1/type III secretion system FlhB-like substrate exporter
LGHLVINSVMKTIVIYPGRFQPMLSHHAEVYRQLTQTFPDAEVYIGTSDKVEPGKSPFNFKEKQQIAQAHGIDASKVLPARVPYVNASYTQFDQDEVSVIFAVGEKDYQERFAPKNIDPKTGIDTKKNGEPYYYQMINSYKNNPMPMSKRGYIYVAPNISSENEIASASAFRQAIIDSPDKEAAKEIVDKQFKVYSNDLFNLLYNKIAGNKMSEELNIIKKLAGLEVTEAAPVEFETVADPKAVSFLDAGKSSSKMSIANRFPEGSDVNDPEVKKEQFLQALIKSPEALLMEINERIDPKDENNAAVQTKLTAIIDGMKENGLAGLNDEDRQFVVVLTSQAIKNMTLVAGDDSPDYEGEPPVKTFDFEGLDLSEEYKYENTEEKLQDMINSHQGRIDHNHPDEINVEDEEDAIQWYEDLLQQHKETGADTFEAPFGGDTAWREKIQQEMEEIGLYKPAEAFRGADNLPEDEKYYADDPTFVDPDGPQDEGVYANYVTYIGPNGEEVGNEDYDDELGPDMMAQMVSDEECKMLCDKHDIDYNDTVGCLKFDAGEATMQDGEELPDGTIAFYGGKEGLLDDNHPDEINVQEEEGAGEYSYTLEYNGEENGYSIHKLTITSPEGETKEIADDFTYFDVEGDELQAELESWFHKGMGVADASVGEAEELNNLRKRAGLEVKEVIEDDSEYENDLAMEFVKLPLASMSKEEIRSEMSDIFNTLYAMGMGNEPQTDAGVAMEDLGTSVEDSGEYVNDDWTYPSTSDGEISDNDVQTIIKHQQTVKDVIGHASLDQDPKAPELFNSKDGGQNEEAVEEANDCPDCNGNGWVADEPEKTCPKCDGEGIDDGYFGGTKADESLEEGKMKEIIQDLKDMDKQEFCSTYPQHADEYEDLCKQYDDDAQSEPVESFDPAMEPNEGDTMFDNAMDAYENKGEEGLAEYMGMSHREFDQELTEFCIEHGLHADDDRDMAIQGMIEMLIDERETELGEKQEGVCPKCGEKKHILRACASCGCSEGIGEEQELDEVWSLIARKIAPAVWGGAKKYAGPLAAKSWQTMKSLTGFTWNNKGTIAAGSIALSYQEEIEIATEFLKGMGEKIEPVIKIAKQYGLPILAVITILYGGKKIHDMITNDDMDDAVAEDNVLEQALVELKKLAGI